MTLNTAPEEEESTAEVALDPRNLSDTILDSWDSHSDEILSNDQFKDELEKEKQEKAELQEMLGTNRYAPDIFHCDYKYFLSQHQIFFIPTSNIFSLDTSPESSDSFPLKSPPRRGAQPSPAPALSALTPHRTATCWTPGTPQTTSSFINSSRPPETLEIPLDNKSLSAGNNNKQTSIISQFPLN